MKLTPDPEAGLNLPLPLREAAAQFMIVGAGRARIQTLTDAHNQLDGAVHKLFVEMSQAIVALPCSEMAPSCKDETIAFIDLGLGKLRALAQDWKKRADREAQLEQPSKEEAARRAINNLAEYGSPLARVRRAWVAALAELKA